ncbi:hypothetical protein BPOR_0135g00030 [Botrytis porri]|uniref:Uncharacterized protein n=1 Tax=Botrytis porri TaxID=87229 RepID=A0A4Z1KWJ3_9HELO|nr:hypothetical protein BPOR_0135g00030 [Botrytis porri]
MMFTIPSIYPLIIRIKFSSGAEAIYITNSWAQKQEKLLILVIGLAVFKLTQTKTTRGKGYDNTNGVVGSERDEKSKTRKSQDRRRKLVEPEATERALENGYCRRES